MAIQAQHAGLEHREQTDGAGDDDDDISGLGRAGETVTAMDRL